MQGEGTGIFLRPTYDGDGYVTNLVINASNGQILEDYKTESQFNYHSIDNYNITLFCHDNTADNSIRSSQIGLEIYDTYGRITYLPLLNGKLEQLNFFDEQTQRAYFSFGDHGLSDVEFAAVWVEITELIHLQAGGHSVAVLQYLPDGTAKFLI